MPATITDPKAVRLSSYDITFVFDGTPSTLAWTLTDLFGNVINSRDSVAITTPQATETITIQGLDLDFYGDDEKDADEVDRRLIVRGVYDSSRGSDLALVEYAEFTIINVPGSS